MQQMRFSSLLIPVFLFFAQSLNAKIDWQSDYMHALTISQEQHKPILLFFNGSDWAGSAMKMKHEVLSAQVFEEKIDKKFVCLEIDFPKHSLISAHLAQQNQELKNRFRIQEFPALVLIDSTERVISQMTYLPENGEKLADDLLKIVEEDRHLMAGLKQLPSSSCCQLQKLYHLAQELNAPTAIAQILEAGLKTEDPFFLLERYRFLVEKGEMKGKEALELRQKLYKLDYGYLTYNGQGIPFTLALIDFQELSQKNLEPEKAAQPLTDYLTLYSEKDQKNVWRIEMMIAQLYLDADRCQEALKHAEKAFKAAPESMHKEISQSLDYIRSSLELR